MLVLETDDSTCAVEAEVYDEMYRLAAVDAANELAQVASTRDLFNEESYVREVRMCFQKKYANYIWLSTAPDDVSKEGTVDASEVTLSVDQRHGHREVLGHAHHRFVDRGISVRVILAEHLTDQPGALLVR